MVTLSQAVSFLDNLYQVEDFKDASLNSLQVEGSDAITGFCLGVDSCMELFEQALENNLNFVIVHHGFFWGRPFAIKNIWKERFKFLLVNDMSLYACHLPMDAHSEIGHNAEISSQLGLINLKPFGVYKGNPIGFSGDLSDPLSLSSVNKTLATLFGNSIRCEYHGVQQVKKIGIISGDASSQDVLDEVLSNNIDLFITGETQHTSYHPIREMKLNVAFCGHYQTEKFSLLKLKTLLEKEFNVPAEFIDIPTGL